MGFFDGFPFTNTHTLNLDWILGEVKKIPAKVDEAVAPVARALDLHVENVANPHNVTLAQVGGAPAGYGLGEDSRWLGSDELFANLTTNGWYTWGTSLTDLNKPFDIGKMLVVNHRGNKSCTQVAFNATSSTTMKIRSQDSGGVWSEWEWVNPPMELGVEYRTTERYNGKPVYVKLVNFGALPNNTSKTVSHGVSNFKYGFDSAVTFSAGQIGTDVTRWSNIINFTVDRDVITIETSGDQSWASVYVAIKYTKTTD